MVLKRCGPLSVVAENNEVGKSREGDDLGQSGLEEGREGKKVGVGAEVIKVAKESRWEAWPKGSQIKSFCP